MPSPNERFSSSVDTQKLTEQIKELNKHFYPSEKKQPKQILTSKNKKK